MAENAEILTDSWEDRLRDLETRLAEERDQANLTADYYIEQYDKAVVALSQMDNVGWNKLTGYDTSNEGLDLDQIKQIRKLLQEWTDTNALLWNGWQARCSFVFSNGYKVDTKQNGGKVSDAIQAKIDKLQNQESVFGDEALRINEKERYTAGVLLVKYSKSKSEFSRLNIDEIEQAVVDPDNPERIWYYYRHYTRDVIDFTTGDIVPKETKVWYRTDKADVYNAPKVSKINGVPVDQDIVVVDDVINRKAGSTFGIPDAFPAAPWALAYSAYLRDGTKVIASLAEWAWQYKPKNKAAGSSAGAAIRSNSDGAGQIAVADGDLTPLPRASAVDLQTGRPIAAQVASALGLSVLTVLMDPGVGGSFGAAETLSDPGLRVMKARQVLNGSFLCRCLALLGLKDAQIVWGKIDPDADYREGQTLSGALGTGLFYADEIREPLAEVAHIRLKHAAAPQGFMLPNNSKSWQRTDVDPNVSETAQYSGDSNNPATPASSAGQQSTVKPDGSNQLANGQGRANTAKPSYGVNDLRGTGGRAK